MSNTTTAIADIKKKVSLSEWQQRIIDCQNSGMSVRAWCRENGISPSTYYLNLKKIRESVIRESVLEESRIIPIEPPQTEIQPTEEIRIEAGGITVTLPENVSSDRLTAVIAALKC